MMKPNALVIPLVMATSLFSGTAVAQTFPTKPVRLVVAFAPGGATDTFARVTAAEMTRGLGQETVKGVDAAVIAGVLAPASVPRAVIERLNAEFAKAVDAPKAKEIFLTNAAEAMKQSPDVMQRVMEQDATVWAAVVKVTRVRLN